MAGSEVDGGGRGGVERAAEKIFSYFECVMVEENEVLWRQGEANDVFAALTILGKYKSVLESEAGTTEEIEGGDIIGLHDLCLGEMIRSRISTVTCTSNGLFWKLSEVNWKLMVKEKPELALRLQQVCLNLSMHRIMHCSNRIFETRCLPV